MRSLGSNSYLPFQTAGIERRVLLSCSPFRGEEIQDMFTSRARGTLRKLICLIRQQRELVEDALDWFRD
jgi:hypothetical protein